MPLFYPRAWSRALIPARIDLPPLKSLLTFIAAIISGVIAATGDILYPALFGGAMIGLIIAGSPAVLFWIAIITSLVFAGVTQLYLPGLQYVRWLVPLAALGLAVHALLSQLAIRENRSVRPTPVILWWALAFFCVVLFSTLVNMPSAPQMLIGLKGYFQAWGILLALAYIPWPAALIDKLPRLLLGVALLQLPFALHEYFVLVPLRADDLIKNGLVPVDIVVGTFGAELEGGGTSSLLSAFQFMVVGGLIALWRRYLLPGIRVFVLSVMLLVPLLINETKISLAYALIVFLVLFRNDIILRPLRFLGASLLFTVLFSIFLTAYTMNAPSDKVQNWTDLIMFTYDYNVKEEELEKLSRWGALKFWTQQHDAINLGNMLLGHGVGVTRVSDSSRAMATMRSVFDTETLPADTVDNIGSHYMGAGRVAVAALLWETGIIGLLCVFGLFGAAFRTALHLEHRYAQDPWHSALFRAAQAAIAIFFVSLWYAQMFVFQVSYQTVIMLLFGYLLYWYRADSSSITAVAPP